MTTKDQFNRKERVSHDHRAKQGMITDLRVIAGKYKGTKLASPPTTATHPMGAREKNALFNMLQSWILNAQVLDLYAGSGALGIEALSRGASSATFVESHPVALRTLRTNLDRISSQSTVVAASVAEVKDCPEWQAQFDLILADPPYDHFSLSEVAAPSVLLRPHGILALSYPAKLGDPELPGFDLITARHYAAAGIGIYQKS